jgi:hypothetical protein
MRLARTLFALAALATAAACSEGASGITAPTGVSRNAAAGGGWIGSDNVVPTNTDGGVTSADDGGWAGSGNIAPVDSTRRGGTWIGSGN